MRAIAHAALAAVALALLSPAARAAEYPYSGYFLSQPADTSADDAELGCAFSFIHQNADGSFVGYHIDKPSFLASGKPRYVEYGAGLCTITPDKVETCTMTASEDEDEVGRSYYDVVGNIAADTIDSASFDTAGQAIAFATRNRGVPAFTSRFVRCAGFSDASLASSISGAMSTLSLDQRGPLQAPEFTDANRAVMGDILRALGTRK